MTTAQVDAIVAAERGQVGKPYVWGGDSPAVGFDCSGLPYWAAAQVGLWIPRTSQVQFETLRRVATPEPADLVFFNTGVREEQPGHVATVIGGGLCVEAPWTGMRVRITPYPPPDEPGIWIMGFGRFVDLDPPLSQPPPSPVQEADMRPAIIEYQGIIHTFSVEGGYLFDNTPSHGRWNLTAVAGNNVTVLGDPAPYIDNGPQHLLHVRIYRPNGDLVDFVADLANGRSWNAYDISAAP